MRIARDVFASCKKIMEISLNAEQKAMFDKSVAAVKSLCDAVKLEKKAA